MLAVTAGSASWYLTRGSGLVTLVLLTASVVLGVLTTVRWRSPRWPRFVTNALHRNVSLVVLVFLGLHIATAVLDGFAPIGWLDAVVPLRSGYRPLWLGLGAVAVDLLIAVTITSLLRPRIGYGVWRAVHWASYACWPVALLHGLGTGTDTKLGWVLFVNMGCLLAVVAAVWWRLLADRTAPAGARITTAVASVVAPVLIVGWLVVEPLRPGWSRKAGTPVALLGSAPASAEEAAGGPAVTPPTAGADAFQPPFTAQVDGTVTRAGGDAATPVLVVDGTLSDGETGRIHLELRTARDFRGDTEVASGTATLGTDAQPALFRGTVTLSGRRLLVLTLTGPAGRRLDVSARLRIDVADGTVTGFVSTGDGG